MNLFKKKIKIVTHNGSFHADDVFACATLSIWAEQKGFKIEIKRSRDESLINMADIVVDVGMKYDSEGGRFDHHQKEGAGTHQNGVPYASFGLVWKHYGSQVCANNEAVAKMIEDKLVVPVDALDNGINTTNSIRKDVPEYRVMKELIYAFRATWRDPVDKIDRGFFEFLDIAKTILIKEIHFCSDLAIGESLVKEQIKRQGESVILILEQDLPWESIATTTKKIRAVVYPEPPTGFWCAESVRDDLNDYESHRMQFPKEWQGLRDDALVDISGVAGAVFCHRALFFVVNKTKEGAIKMAEIALQNSKN